MIAANAANLLASSAVIQIAIGCTIAIGLLVVFGVVLGVLRRKLLGGKLKDDRDNAQTLEQLRESGLLTDEEFSRVRRKAMGITAAKAAPPKAAAGEKSAESLSKPAQDVDLSSEADETKGA